VSHDSHEVVARDSDPGAAAMTTLDLPHLPVVMASSEGVPGYLGATAALVIAAAVVGYLSVA